MSITAKLMAIASSLQRLAATLNGDGDSTGAQVLEDNAGRLQELAAECADKVLVKPTTWAGINLVQRYASICIPPVSIFTRGTILAHGDTTAEAIANLQVALDQKDKPDQIEASQVEGQPLDVVQVPRDVYNVVLNRLGYVSKYVVPDGDMHDIVVREHERLKMCAPTTGGR